MFQEKRLVSLVRFGEEDPEVDFNKLAENPAFQDFLRAHVEKEVTPLKNKNADLLNEKKNLAEKMKAFESGIQEKDDLEALKAGKLDFQALLDKRIAANSQSWQEKLAAEQSEKEELRKAVDGEKGKLKQFQIKQTIGQVALKNEFFHPSALDDLMSVAGSTWQLGESGELVARDSSGNVVFGKTGRPLTPEEWVSGLTATKPHYFKQMPGSGARGVNGTGKTVSTAEWQRTLIAASADERKALLAKRASGEIVIN
ncbi:hypothetical protein ACUZXZ_08350 [Pseudomonas juntendi]|uniref:hypothetical protein n=1 Tax=Pseudomonas juntendi TaxID=2666183 RepID=UPI001F47B097|nr:hypothetical protein [Pseudomonas juntendi]MCO7057162.1 hypothetical protein [Pseudomonas juntendi]UJM14047.1 hypothetical protein L1P09_07635 [Pseudomonas juntendi]